MKTLKTSQHLKANELQYTTGNSDMEWFDAKQNKAPAMNLEQIFHF